jgi:hypothetical protein
MHHRHIAKELEHVLWKNVNKKTIKDNNTKFVWHRVMLDL